MDIVIRPYTSDDWEGVCRVHDAARPIEVAEFMPPDTVPVMRDAAIVDGEFYESNVYVACDDAGEVVGFIAVHGEELTWMYVAPHVHRRGVGRRLVEHVREELGPHGYVLAAQENRGAYAFYQAVGFRPVAFFPGETRGFPCTCVRVVFAGSLHAARPPHGFPEDDPGRGVRGEDGVWRWER